MSHHQADRGQVCMSCRAALCCHAGCSNSSSVHLLPYMHCTLEARLSDGVSGVANAWAPLALQVRPLPADDSFLVC